MIHPQPFRVVQDSRLARLPNIIFHASTPLAFAAPSPMKLTLRTLDGELSELEVEQSDYINSVATRVAKLKKPDEKV